MKINDLNRLTNSPSFRGGISNLVKKAGEVISKDAPKIFETFIKTIFK